MSAAAESRPTESGRFITVEGIEGVGKSTNVEFVADTIRSGGFPVLVTREPGGTPLGEQIRQLLLAPSTAVPPMTELLLMFAARAVHLERVIRPALASGRWVVCDRFTDATYAYQGGGRQVDTQRIRQLEELVQGTLRPDLTLLLDVPLEVSASRQQSRAGQDRFERESPEFFGRVRAAYLSIAAAEPGRVKVIAADQPLPAVRSSLQAIVSEFMRAHA